MDFLTGWAGCIPILHLAVTWYLVGLIWVVQRIVYPAMEYVDPAPDRSVVAERQHCDRMGFVVGPMMLAEGALASWMLLDGISVGRWGLPGLGAVLLLVIWLSTAFIQMPLHSTMLQGPDRIAQRRLVATNWIRTISWSLRGLIALYLV